MLFIGNGPSGQPEDKRLKNTYTGYYKLCENIELKFGKHDCECVISSTDFAGHFKDKVSGSYAIDGNHVNVEWKMWHGVMMFIQNYL